MRRKLLSVLIMGVMATVFLLGCANSSPTESSEQNNGQAEAPTNNGEIITLVSTTSTVDSGLLDFLIPYFTADTGWEVQVVSVGTGAALQLGRDGEADVVLVHSRRDEDEFVADGYADKRFDVMYNDFIIVGPADGGIAPNNDIETTFTTIFENNLPFVSRGDDSGTHIRELYIWDGLGITPEENTEYASVGQGMGASLNMAVEKNAFLLIDRGTWLSFSNTGDLIVICEGHPDLLNPYGLMAVSSSENLEGAEAFIDWMTSPTGQELISIFGLEEFGQPLFFPDLGACIFY